MPTQTIKLIIQVVFSIALLLVVAYFVDPLFENRDILSAAIGLVFIICVIFVIFLRSVPEPSVHRHNHNHADDMGVFRDHEEDETGVFEPYIEN